MAFSNNFMDRIFCFEKNLLLQQELLNAVFDLSQTLQKRQLVLSNVLEKR